MAGKEFSAGTVYVQVLPSLDGWAKQVQDQVNRQLRDLKVNVTGVEMDDRDIRRQVDDKLKRVDATVAVKSKVEADPAQAAEAGKRNAGAFADAFTARVRAALKALPEVKLDADSSEADREIAAIRTALVALHGQKIGVDLSADEALADLEFLRGRLDALRNESVSVQVRVDAGAASAQLAAIQAQARAVDGTTAEIAVRAADDGSLVETGTRVQRLIAVCIAGSGAIGGLGAALIALGAGAVAGGIGLAAITPGITAIGAALKAQRDVSKQAGQTAAQEAAQRLSAANQVANAQDGLANATLGVAEAQRSASASVRSALQGQVRAEQSLQSAQVSALRAQQALTDARHEASRSLEDMRNQVIDDALSQRAAVLGLQSAQAELNATLADTSSTQAQRDQAQLTYDQAVQQLSEISLAYQRSQADAAAANAAGVEGSVQVVSAQDAQVASQRQVREAQTALGESAAKVDEARVSGATQVAKAQQQVTQAQRSLAQAQASVATQAVAQGTAQAKLTEALEKLTPQSLRLVGYLKAQSGEWALLQKASQGFAPGLQAGMQKLEPSFGQINDNVGILSSSVGGFFESIGTGLADSGPFFDQIALSSITLFPRFGDSVGIAAKAVQDLVVEMIPVAGIALDTVDGFSALVSAWAPFIADASGPLLVGLQEVMLDLEVLGPLLVSLAGPAADLTSALTHGLADGLTNLNPALKPFLDALVDIVETMAPLLGDVGTLGAVLAKVLMPALEITSRVLSPLVFVVGKFVDLIGALPTPIIAVGLGLLAIHKYGGPLEAMFRKIGTSATFAMEAVGRVAGKAGASEATVGKFATTGQKVAGAFDKVGKALPFAGLAFIGISSLIEMHEERTRKATEATEKLGSALVRGGRAADEAKAHIKTLRDNADRLGGSLGGVGGEMRKAADAAEESARKQVASMSEVEIAQGRVDQAQQDYNFLLQQQGPNSRDTIAAHAALGTELGVLKEAQWRAAEATKSTTEKLQDQQDQALAMTNARVAHARSGIRLTEAGKRIAEVQAKEGHTAEELASAQLDLISAQATYVATAGEAAAATDKMSGSHDTSAARARGSAVALGELARRYGQNLPEEMKTAMQSIGEADAKFLGLGFTVDTTGQKIFHLPGGPGQDPVDLKFTSNLPVIIRDAEYFAEVVRETEKFLSDIRREDAKRAEEDASHRASFKGVPLPSNAGEVKGGLALALSAFGGWGHFLASGGLINGSGTGDTVPALLTPGEFVFSQPAVAALGLDNVIALHDVAVQRLRGGGPVTPLRLAAGGSVPGLTPAPGAQSTDMLGQLGEMAHALFGITAAGSPLADLLTTRLIPALRQTMVSSGEVAVSARRDWAEVTAAVNSAVSAITTSYLTTLRGGLSSVNTAVTNTALTFGSQFSAIRKAAGDPVRWTLQYPFNAGLIAAWNVIDSTFAVGKPLAPIPIGFAAGGGVFGGQPGKDSVPAYLMPGEYVLPVDMVNQIGMSNLEAARRSVLAGGSVEGVVPGLEAGGAVTQALTFATSQVGKPYVWGAVGPGGYDCSGFMSAIANVALGLPPHQRRFTTAAFAPGRGAGGFLPGTGSSFAIGVSGSHMAGTLAGHNVESTTKNGISGVRVDGDASGALDSQFTKGAFYLPEIGGAFVPGAGGGGGGASFDWNAMLDSSFGPTRDLIARIVPGFGAGSLAAGATAEMLQMINSVVGWAKANLAAGGGAGGGTPGTGPVVDQVRGVAARYGWGEGSQWEALSWLLGHESGWRPDAQNPTSTAYGLFQFLDSTWAGTGIGKTSNPTLQAEAGLNYIQGRYRDPAGAQAFWQSHHWYDDGGYLPPGLSLAYNGTGHQERVLNPQQEHALTSGATGGQFTGTLQLDSGEFLGRVHGEIRRANNATGLAIARRTR